jgi:hypothetical protein
MVNNDACSLCGAEVSEQSNRVNIIACLVGWARMFEHEPARAKTMMSLLVSTGSFR